MAANTIAHVIIPVKVASQFEASQRTIWRWSALIFVLGMIVRVALVASKYPATAHFERVEPVNLAISLVNSGSYADAYGPGSSPSAHDVPLHPLLLSLLILGFGTGPAAAFAIAMLGSIFAAGAFALLPMLAVRSGLELRTGAAAGIAGAILPVNFRAQTSGIFDAPLTAAALVALSILICSI